MKSFIKYLIIILLFSYEGYYKTNYAKASSGPDRCYIKECLCLVVPEKPNKLHPKAPVKRVISIYFSENSYEISLKDKNDLQNLVRLNSRYSKKASIIGYTDGCGSSDHNNRLSKKRAEAVRLAVKYQLPYAGIIAAGEKTGKHSEHARRVDIVFHRNNRLTTAVEKIPSDFYLIDASGSMWSSYNQWEDLIGASLKPGSKVYLSITNSCQNGQMMKLVSPSGGTEIWWSYWNLIDKMRPGETLLIVSDFESQVPLSSRERALFERKIRESGIIVRSIVP